MRRIKLRLVRTRVTINPDLAKQVKLLAHRRGLSFKQALNEVIRRGLVPARQGNQPKYVIQPPPHFAATASSSSFQAGSSIVQHTTVDAGR